MRTFKSILANREGTSALEFAIIAPLFFLALAAVVIGVQLFLTGFLAEMVSLTGAKKHEYLIADTIRVSK